MSRANIVMERIIKSLDNDPIYHQNVLFRSVAAASFGLVQIAMFILPVADNDLNAEMNERHILIEMQEEGIYVAFHKTRRQEGERLITATKALEPNNINYTFGNLKGFTKLWLIDATNAKRAVAEMRAKQNNSHVTVTKR